MLFDRRPEWFDNAWWVDNLRAAIATADPVLCNLRVTLAHYELSLALRSVFGEDSGPNFHTWAVWGSKKAGTTIRQKDVPHLREIAALFGGGIGLAAAWLVRAAWPVWSARTSWLVAGVGAGLAAWGLRALAGRSVDHASRAILGGNVTVLDDIGHVTARFVSTFGDEAALDPARLAVFLSSLRPEPTESGGQALLKGAFTHYYLARHESDFNARQEHMLLGNLYAILHEHIRLEPYIDSAIPRPLRRWVTAHLLHFRLGQRRLSVDETVPAWQPHDFPDVFQRLENAELVRFLSGPGGWDRTPDSLAGSQAGDWSEIRERMNYIGDLFRSRHFDPDLFSPPYTEAQVAEILAGRIPPAPL